MKRKDLESAKVLTTEELQKKIVESERSLAEIVRERYTKQSKNVRAGRLVRTTIAQLKTIVREKELLA
jgi:ribosomal protein L29